MTTHGFALNVCVKFVPLMTLITILIFLSRIFNYNYFNKINAEIIKNSHRLNLSKTSKIVNNDIDPDKYFYSQLNNSENKYYLEEDFNSMVSNKSLHSDFSILHANARRLDKNICNLTDYLKVH